MRSALPVVTIVFCLLAGDLARASEPITIVYARGRNKVAIQLWKQSEDEIDNGNVSAALQHADAALRSDPTLYPALYTRAKCYVRQHKLEAALQDCSSALKQDPTFVEAGLLRASINSRLGNYAAALKEFDHIVSIRPRLDGLARAMSDRAYFHLTCPDTKYRDTKQALKDATTACKMMQWRDDDMIDTLALACAENGDWDGAVKYETQALSTAGIKPDVAQFYQRRLEGYKAKKII